MRRAIGTANVERDVQDDFHNLVRPHLDAMLWLAARLLPGLDREDVVQEALVKAWRKRDQFDPARGTPQAWLLAIVANEARGMRRRLRRVEPSNPGDAHTDPFVERDLDLDRAIRQLSTRQQLALSLYYFLDLPIHEVAAVLECSDGTAKATLHQARHQLRKRLGEEYR